MPSPNSPSPDYCLSLAIYRAYRGVPVRKAVARGYVDLRALPAHLQARYVRLGSLFFQGRSWVKLLGHDPEGCEAELSPEQARELEALLALKEEVGPAVIRLLDDDDTIDPVVRDITMERLESMGFAGDDE